MANEPKQTPEDRLAQLERERALIVAAFDECTRAMEKGQDAAFVVSRFVGIVESTLLRSGNTTVKAEVPILLSSPDSQRLLTKKQLCTALNLPSVWALDRLRKQKKIPFIRTGHRTALYNPEKVKEALAHLETAVAYPEHKRA